MLGCTFSVLLLHPNPCFALFRLDCFLDKWSAVTASRDYRPLINPPPVPRKITYKYNKTKGITGQHPMCLICYFVSVSSFTAHIIFTFRLRVKVRFSVRVG